MSALSAVSKTAGVIACAVGDMDGTAFEQGGNAPQGTSWIGAMAYACTPLTEVGDLLGLGTPQGISAKSADASWVVAFQSERVFVVKCDSARSATNVEAALTDTDWVALVEAANSSETEQSSRVISTSTEAEREKAAVTAVVEPVQAADGARKAIPPRPTVPRPAGTPPRASAVEDQERAPLSGRQRGGQTGQYQVPTQKEKAGASSDESQRLSSSRAAIARPQAASARTAGARGLAATPGDAVARPTRQSLQAELRRTLVKGQLAQAEIISLKLVEAAKASGSGPADATPIPPQLLEGIASYLAGDIYGGLVNLKTVEGTASNASSLRWVALIWCVRASAAAGEGLDVAHAYAKSALALAGSLDSEARSVSTFELAGVEFQQGDFTQALVHTRAARAQLINSSDRQLLSGYWLLEARVLAAIGKHHESLDAAANAREQRPSWPPPATFIARRALHEGRLDDASTALQPLLGHKPAATEVENVNRILECVRSGMAPMDAACQFLELAEAPPTQENVRQLEALSESYPKIDQFRDAFGWRLLRTGQYDAAKDVFEALCSRADLAQDVRSSVLLALGCIAAVGPRDTKSVANIRAAVDATPKNFKLAQPSPPPSIKSTSATPSELRQSDLPPPPSYDAGGDEPSSPPAMGRSAPMFSGSLQLFGIPDLLEFLRSGQRTGTLICSSTAGIGAIQMRKGRITGAASPRAKELKAYLVAMGVASAGLLDQATETEKDGKTLIGDILVKSGAVTAANVREALRTQIRDAIKDLMEWGEGKFAFDPEAPMEHCVPEIQIEVDPQQALLDIFKEMDEGLKDNP
jgi:hypothetical protein